MRSGQIFLTLTMLTTAGGLAYALLTQGEMTAGLLQEKATVAAVDAAPKAERPILVEEALEPAPLSEFVEMIARPLFSPSRRPPPPATVDATPDSPLEKAVTTAEQNQFMVIGIVIAQDEKVALLKQLKKSNEIVRVKEGQILSDWTVSEIRPESVTIQQNGVTDVVKLSDNVLTAVEKRTLAQKARQEQLNAAKREALTRRAPVARTDRRNVRQPVRKIRPVRRARNIKQAAPRS